MKKLLMVLVIAGLLSSAAFAVDLTVNATVSPKLEISRTGAGNGIFSLALNNSGDAVTSTDVNNLKVISSQKNWQITFTSLYDGYLIAAGSSTPIEYLVKVDSSGVGTYIEAAGNQLADFAQIVDGGLTIVPKTTANGGKTPMVGIELPISVRVPSYTEFIQTLTASGGVAQNLVYSDTITIAISAN